MMKTDEINGAAIACATWTYSSIYLKYFSVKFHKFNAVQQQQRTRKKHANRKCLGNAMSKNAQYAIEIKSHWKCKQQTKV